MVLYPLSIYVPVYNILECLKAQQFTFFFFISFRFPLGDIERLKQWLLNVRRSNWIPSKSSRLCSTHFKEDQLFIDKEVDGYISVH